MAQSMKTIVVVGGGITGLSTMHYLTRELQHKNIRLVLVEKEAQLGGKMATHEENGFVMELGADSIVARHKSVMPLIEELGLEDRVVYNGTGVSYIYTQNELHAIPLESMYGIPMNKEALQQSTLISEAGKRAALNDLTLPNEQFTKDSSIGEFLEYFFGEELVKKQIAPVLSGIYSGDLYSLTLASTIPYLIDYKNQYGSILKGYAANKDKFISLSHNKFLSFKNGLRELFERFEEVLTTVEFLKNTAVTKLETVNEKTIVHFDHHEAIEADHVVLATPHRMAQEALGDERLTPAFDAFKTSSIITVYLGYEVGNDVLPAEGTGFIVANSDAVNCDACTWTSAKWPNTSKDGKLLLRVFYKKTNPKFAELIKLTEEELAQLAMKDVATSLNIEEQPLTIKVSKWTQQMPVYNLEHAAAVKNLEQKMQNYYPTITLAGCSYYGVGIGLCIANGKEIATRIAAQLTTV